MNYGLVFTARGFGGFMLALLAVAASAGTPECGLPNATRPTPTNAVRGETHQRISEF